MNATERRTYDWLLTRYAPADVTFRRRRTPMFETTDGRGWEGKLARAGVITFSRGQLTLLWARPHVMIVIFEDGGPPFGIDVRAMGEPGRIEGTRFSFVVVDYRRLQSLRVRDSAYLAARIAAARAGVTVEEWASNVIERAAKQRTRARRAAANV